MSFEGIERLKPALAGVSTQEAARALMLLSGKSEAYTRAIEAIEQGDWDTYATVCDELDDAELEALAGLKNPIREVVFTSKDMGSTFY